MRLTLRVGRKLERAGHWDEGKESKWVFKQKRLEGILGYESTEVLNHTKIAQQGRESTLQVRHQHDYRV